MILANPSFGKSQAVEFVYEEGDLDKEDAVVYREAFWTSTSNKQLNFVEADACETSSCFDGYVPAR